MSAFGDKADIREVVFFFDIRVRVRGLDTVRIRYGNGYGEITWLRYGTGFYKNPYVRIQPSYPSDRRKSPAGVDMEEAVTIQERVCFSGFIKIFGLTGRRSVKN